MGRMWQTLLLYNWQFIFGWLPIETIIKERQDEYYRVLGECDKCGESSLFIEFMLEAIHETLVEITDTDQDTDQVSDQVKQLLIVLGSDTMSRKEIMDSLKLSHIPTFRKNYLKPAIELGLVEMTLPDKPNSSKQKYRRTQ